jgi:toxin secretion/phage lysis holin
MAIEPFSMSNIRSVGESLIEFPLLKVFVAMLFAVYDWVFVGVNAEAMLVVYALLVMDTVTGLMIAFRNSELSSSGFFRFAGKVFIYMMLMATAALVDRSLPAKFGMSIMYAFLAVTEAISIMENLGVLGYPVPTKFLKALKVMNKGE